MTKILAFDFLGLYAAILRDVAAYHPQDLPRWNRDSLNLAHLNRTRGQPIFTMDLPALGKALDKALSTGSLESRGLNLARGSHRLPNIPRLFQGLWERMFDYSGCLKSDIDPNDVLFLRTLLYAGKNLEWECAPKYLFETTKEFFNVEAQLPEPNQEIWHNSSDLSMVDLGHLCDLDLHRMDSGLREGSFVFDEPSSSSPDLGVLLGHVQRVADRVITELGVFNPDDYDFRHGPGAVSDLGAGSYKYSFPSWNPRLEHVFPYDRYGSTGLDLMDRLQHDGIELPFVEGHSVLIDVPKTQKGPRLIAKEPTCNQWAQQCIRDFLMRRVEETSAGISVHFRDQTYNQQLALLGSRSGEYATIDLKSASDRLSCSIVQRIFRRNPFLLEAMIACRTRYLSNPRDKKFPSLIRLRKFSTQGSALTFPVQTICFLSMAIGVGRHCEPKTSYKSLFRKVGVFGDDIIVPSTWVAGLRTVLHGLGLRVNDTKTFSEGNFRESCGMDAFRGYDVTPAHVTLMPDMSHARSIASSVAVSNNFFTKGFWHAADWLKARVQTGKIPVVSHRSGIFGFKAYSGVPVPSRERWNEKLQLRETHVLTISAKARVLKKGTAANLLQYFTERPAPYIKYESGVVVAGVPVFRNTWVETSLLSS